MGAILPAVGAVSGAVGAIGGKNQQKAANAQANQAMQQQQQAQQAIQNMAGQETDVYNKFYQPLQQGLMQGFQGEQGTSNQFMQQLLPALLQAGVDPSVISKITGINSPQLMQQAIQYLSNPQNTQLAKQTPGVQSFFNQEMKTGLNPMVAQNAQSQVQQNLQQQISDAMAQAKPGQNVNALVKDLRNQALTQSTNLAGNLAGQSQNFMNTGAQGALNTAQGLDQQYAQMLQGGANLGNQFNQQQYNNLGTSTASGQGVMQALQNYLGQGQGLLSQAGNQLSGVSGNALQAQQVGQNAAANAGQGFASSIGGLTSNLGQLFAPKPQTAAPAQQASTNFGNPGVWGNGA